MSEQGRRSFLYQISAAVAPKPALAGQSDAATSKPAASPVNYPRTFAGRNLHMIAFPLGGVAAGSISLGGRGQLRDWEIFNKPDKGNAPTYAFPAIWANSGNGKPVTKVLESQYLPPYEGQSGLGSNNAPGLARLAGAKFTGEYPLAHIDFEEPELPVRVSLDAFSPFIPHDGDDSGLPVAILRYKVRNPGRTAAQVSIAWSIDNPVNTRSTAEKRQNEYRRADGIAGLLMTNPALPNDDDLHGSFVLAALGAKAEELTHLLGWPKGRWWNSPMLFWDDFTADGKLGPEPATPNAVGSLCRSVEIPAGKSADFPFLLAWHFPNRTPERCGWSAPKGKEKTVIGNFYSTRFPDAWAAAEYAAAHLDELEKKTRRFVAAMRETTLPPAIKEAASANLSTLATTTCFRTADGEFHGFEGVNDKSGCCHGNCTHVWNYETATAHLFPAFARSLRKAAFGYSMDDAGAIHFRQALPDGFVRSGFAAADGQMGQILHAYLDWNLSGDNEWLKANWPRFKKALEFCWVPGGWDANRDGVMEGVQHNTYDVEFYGPNPQCGIYYLGGLRAGEEMAKAVGDATAASEYRRLFENGRKWIDANLFNGEYYVQKTRGFSKDQIAPSLRSSMGSENTEQPEYQVGEGCLVDQLVGQYLAEVCGLGPLLSEENIRKTLQSIYRYNYKRSLKDHNTVQRTFALNDEAALVICDYGKAERPRIPFPYYAEVMTGFEYAAATHMLYAGMEREGIECITNVRRRYDGERRNPWDEAECGHHYARAMAAWSGMLALSGFRFRGRDHSLSVFPRTGAGMFRSFWSNGTGWGTFVKQGSGGLSLKVEQGEITLQSVAFAAGSGPASAMLDGRPLPCETHAEAGQIRFQFRERVVVKAGSRLDLRTI